MTRIIALVALSLAVAGCVVPLGDSTGPGDSRSSYFSNNGPNGRLFPSEPVTLLPQSFRLR